MRTFLRRSFARALGAAPAILAAALLFVAAPAARAQQGAQQGASDGDSDGDLLRQFEDNVTTFTLENGLTFVVIERHDAPVASFVTYADVGSVDEPAGETGIAHMFEHIAFKGTTTIGTKDIEAEEQLMGKQERLAQALRRERARGPQADTARINELQKKFDTATENAKKPVKQNEYVRILRQAGVDMSQFNANTAADFTRFFYSLPSNKAELFFAMESDRFKNPVFREFYTERDVVEEERRRRVGSSPQGRLIEEFLAAAFKAHPYGEPTIGHMSDLENLTRTEARKFYNNHYVPSNLTIAIAGDVDPPRMRQFARKYFGDIKAREPKLPVTTTEPEQTGEHRVTLHEQTQPLLFIGYHRPRGQAPEDPAYRVLQDVLAGGRTSRLYKQLVEKEKALAVQAAPTFPGSKYPNLFLLVGMPSSGVSPEALEDDIYAVLDDVKKNGITPEELDRAKTSARVSLINGLDSNLGLALQLAQYEQVTGDWRNAFRKVQRIQDVTAQQVQQVAQETFKRGNRTVGMIKNASGDEEDAPTASAK